ENATGVVYQATASDPDAGTTLTWLLGGTDAALFDISAAGAVTFKIAPNFEAPADSGADNAYDITVTASDGTLSSAARAVAIMVTDVLESVTGVGGAGADLLIGSALNDTLSGGAGNDTLLGLEGNDALNGGIGADHMTGGAGNDTYTVDNSGDVVVEAAGGGDDRIVASISSVLGADLERLSLSGAANLNGTGNALANRLDGNAGANILDGGEGNDSLFGLGGNDRLIGGTGADWLDGGLGADSMEGGTDNDTYIVDNAGDIATEAAGGGSDRVLASISYTLGAELERLALAGTADLTGTGNALANRLDGNAGANTLDGGEGNDSLFGLGGNDRLMGGTGADWLDGGLGADSMEGGADNDTYIVDNAGDNVTEAAGGGSDRVLASISYTLGAEMERLALSGTADLAGTGNPLANRLDGNAGANTLDGGEGNDSLFGLGGNDRLIGGGGVDWLDGGLGADSMEGGAGADRFWFRDVIEADGDVIADFSMEQGDRIDLRAMDAGADALGDQSFAWIGGTAFSGVSGELRFADAILEGDVNGDGMADFQIGLGGAPTLLAASIWL
ncbi:MAG: hypothetical protein K5Q68_09355, partial [Roseococcus sp.]|nr:hypothetical protein [Roseococcus sp.]